MVAVTVVLEQLNFNCDTTLEGSVPDPNIV